MEPAKGNEDIRNDRDAFIDAYLRARDELGRIPGVIDVAFGRKETGGDFRTSVAILVYVREKKPDDALPPDERIPPTFEGYRTDVRVMQRVSPEICDNVTPYDPIRGGIQIQPVNRKATIGNNAALGTLGCIVKKIGDTGDDRYLLTNSHVMFPADTMLEIEIEPEHRVGIDDHVYHPWAPGGSPRREGTLVGIIEERGLMTEPVVETKYTRSDGTVASGFFTPFIDCAIARIPGGSTCFGRYCCGERVASDPSIVENNPLDLLAANANKIKGVREVFLDPDIFIDVDPVDHGIFDPNTATDENRVWKVGRTTGATVGIVTAVNAPVEDEALTLRTGINVIRHNMIEIALDRLHPTSALGVNCKMQESFSAPGDSGSLVLDKDNMAIGLLYGGPRTTVSTPGHLPRPSKLLKYACHISAVLSELKIEIITTAPAVASDAFLPPAEGKTLFAAQGIEGQATLDLAGELGTTPIGRAMLDELAGLQPEIVHLVRGCRPVKLVWHRNKGPAFLTHLLNHLRGDTDSMPLEVGGVSRETLLAKMADIFAMYGSLRLHEAIEQYREYIPILASSETIRDLIAALQPRVPVGTAE